MNKIKQIIIVVVSIVLLSSCGKNNDDIIGVWHKYSISEFTDQKLEFFADGSCYIEAYSSPTKRDTSEKQSCKWLKLDDGRIKVENSKTTKTAFATVADSILMLNDEENQKFKKIFDELKKSKLKGGECSENKLTIKKFKENKNNKFKSFCDKNSISLKDCIVLNYCFMFETTNNGFYNYVKKDSKKYTEVKLKTAELNKRADELKGMEKILAEQVRKEKKEAREKKQQEQKEAREKKRKEDKIKRANLKKAKKLYRTGSKAIKKGQLDAGIKELKEAIVLGGVDAMNELAWFYSTYKNTSYHNGKKAIELSLKAIELKPYKIYNYYDTLAAAYARDGQFKKAITTQKTAKEKSGSGMWSNRSFKRMCDKRIKQYEQNQAYTEK
ncbi:MAG: hypothetical protein DRQ51_04685 [Gammaproteobacteria bacterium]|nr:MAG: hypothetical protein DRQ51_04685 [Gammaproteobacteria bacterium]